MPGRHGTGSHWVITRRSSSARLGHPYLFGNIPLCLDRGGSVTVTRVGFGENLGDLNVDAFTLRSFHRPFDNDGVNLGEPIGLEGRALSVKHDVSQACQPEDSSRMEFAELVLQVSRRTQKTAFGRGIVVTYLSDGVERRLGISLGIGLCAPADAPIESVCD
ncbi:hypothetical protein Pmi06nite_25650 [Planotetraspora mira]|uniref:Uncharacterized protein n=1 Tax=Planotetraspora mira TaxID=58121 RepID=A0A8J3TL74_9ACTN|nr:hypothetical protein Pmi06nite_25650 [Planotetraspora mira]